MDPIADLLNRIRNANAKQKDRVDIPYSKIKLGIVKIFKDEGFIANYKLLYADQKQGTIRVFLKFSPQKESVLKGLKRVSRPGLRIYRSYQEIPRVVGGFGISILSTPTGLLTDRQAREKKIGGEVLCQIW